MSRDVRGYPGKYTPKNLPRLKLTDLLRRRKMTLKQLLVELGISTYEALNIRCARMGVVPPSQAEFDDVFPPMSRVNSAQEGVVVLEPPRVVDEISGRPIDPEAPVEAPSVTVTSEPYVPVGHQSPSVVPERPIEPTEDTPKKSRKRRDNQPTE